LGPLSGWNVIYYFLKEIKYFELDETTAKEITAAFKARIDDLGPEVSPVQVLMNIAEKDFGLSRLPIPEQYKDTVVQRMDGQPKRNGPNGIAHVR